MMTNVCKTVALSLLLSAALQSASAHEHWISVADEPVAAPATVTVHLCSGHYFPKSSFAVKDNVLDGLVARLPDGTHADIATTVVGKQRTGSVNLASNGVTVIGFALKRPRATTPSYEGKTILVGGADHDDPARYAIGHGLEVVPQRALSQVHPGDRLPLALLLDGQPISGSLEASAEAGKSSLLTSTPERAAPLAIRAPGRYLITAHVKGRGCSLLFSITEPINEDDVP